MGWRFESNFLVLKDRQMNSVVPFVCCPLEQDFFSTCVMELDYLNLARSLNLHENNKNGSERMTLD